MVGLIHLYWGDGKGKTTAAVGLAVRAAGRGKKVVLVQFLKSGKTGELESLKQLGVQVIRSEVSFGFTWNMDEATREACKREQVSLFAAACGSTDVDLLVLDEVVDALGDDMIEPAALAAFLREKPSDLEIVLTGHKKEDWLYDVADYVTEMKKTKHPFDEGVRARSSIEF